MKESDFLPIDVSKSCWINANIVDPDQMPHFAAADLSLIFAQTYLSQLKEIVYMTCSVMYTDYKGPKQSCAFSPNSLIKFVVPWPPTIEVRCNMNQCGNCCK